MRSMESIPVSTLIAQSGLVLLPGEIAFQCDCRSRQLAEQQQGVESTLWRKAAMDIAHLAKTAQGWPE